MKIFLMQTNEIYCSVIARNKKTAVKEMKKIRPDYTCESTYSPVCHVKGEIGEYLFVKRK